MFYHARLQVDEFLMRKSEMLFSILQRAVQKVHGPLYENVY
jgi:hypothetical protein